MTSPQRINSSRSLASSGDLFIPQQMLTILEEVGTSHQQSRILVSLNGGQQPDVFLLCLQYLLQHTPGKPLLVLSSASAQPELVRCWQTARSMDGQLLAQRFPLCFPPDLPPGEQTRLCFSTVRALQLQQLEDAEQWANRFDVIVAYDFPARLSPVWKRVIERTAPQTLIAFCANPQPEVVQWCDTITPWESK